MLSQVLLFATENWKNMHFLPIWVDQKVKIGTETHLWIPKTDIRHPPSD